jgi:pimeloyl-ACP methyl ester carboxylesterase
VKSIKANYDKIVGFENGGNVYKGPIKVLWGEKSHYHPASAFKNIFPNIRDEDLVKIIGAGHWVHADKPLETINEITKFLDKIENKV